MMLVPLHVHVYTCEIGTQTAVKLNLQIYHIAHAYRCDNVVLYKINTNNNDIVLQ